MSEAFEELVATLLEAEGYWVKRNIKIHLSKDDLAEIRVRSGSLELDIVAFKHGPSPEVLVVECKSFPRSGGVDWTTFDRPGPGITRKHRYRLFWDQALRDAISKYLIASSVTPDVPHVFSLASSATKKSDHPRIRAHLLQNGMRFLDRDWLDVNLTKLGNASVYHNSISATLATYYHSTNRGTYA